MRLEMDEDLIERKERGAHRVIDGVERRVLRRVRSIRIPGGRATVGVIVLAVLAADLGVIGARHSLPLQAPPERPAARLGDGAALDKLPPVGTLDGAGPFAVYASEEGASEHVRVFAADIGTASDGGGFPTVFLGRFPGFVTDFAGVQGQAAGNVVPIGTAQETVDASRATRLWLLRRGQTARPLLSTFDFVSAYALNHDGTALAISRRSVLSPARGAFLWLYPLEPRRARQIGSLRRPGGAGPSEQLRPVAWGPGNTKIFAVPFCDQCTEDALRGMYVVSLADGSVTQLPATKGRSIGSPSFSADGSRMVYEEVSEPVACPRLCGVRRLVAVDTPTGRIRELARSSELAFDYPVISPDGRLVAYATQRNHEVEWRSVETGRVLGSISVVPSQDTYPATWISDTQLLVVGQSSSARPDGPSEGNLFRVTRDVSSSGRDVDAHLEVIASAPAALTFLGWIR